MKMGGVQMKKYLKSFVIILILIIAIFFVYEKINTYTLNEINEMISTKVSKNMYLKSESSTGSIEETFAQNNKLYWRFLVNDELVNEMIINTENKEQINIDYTSKEIKYYENDSDLETILTEHLNSYYAFLKEENAQETYKYLGKENIDGKNFIKFSIVVEGEFLGMQDKVKVIYYLNLDSKQIEKIEYYNIYEEKVELYNTTKLTYSYDTVKEEDILAFDSNNYPDFKIEN